jgi:2-polyprenyl-3-methyl-5-hydroxy-6-metoxy-1,4-benzoquinol methylase
VNPHFVERKACPVCGSVELNELFHCPYTSDPIRTFVERWFSHTGTVDLDLLEDAEYILRECRSCQLIFQEQIPDEHLADTVSEKWSDPDKAFHHREKSGLASRGRNALEVMSVIEFLGGDPQELRFLDFGMGWGNWVRIAEAFGVECFGLEASESRLAHARTLGLKVIGPEGLRDLRFDFINTEQVFEHLPDPYATAADLAGALTERGILKISVPNGRGVKRNVAAGRWHLGKGSKKGLFDVTPLQHINCFTHRPLVRLGRRAGLRPVKLPARLRYRYMPTWERFGKLAKRTVGQHYRSLRHQETNVWFRRADAFSR